MDDTFFSNDEIDEELDLNADIPEDDEQGQDDEYEEIDSDEVDRVVSALEELGNQTNSENIRHLLEEASTAIYYLVYADEDDSEEEGELLEDAA